MLRLGDKHRDKVGIVPRIAFHGPVDTSVPEAVSSEVSRSRRGTLNVARHARASSVEVVVSVEGGWLSLSIADDGIGIAGGPHAGHGVRNMVTRATNLGGTCSRRAASRLGRPSPGGCQSNDIWPQIGPVRGLD